MKSVSRLDDVKLGVRGGRSKKSYSLCASVPPRGIFVRTSNHLLNCQQMDTFGVRRNPVFNLEEVTNLQKRFLSEQRPASEQKY
jgi:hypothetical protein